MVNIEIVFIIMWVVGSSDKVYFKFWFLDILNNFYFKYL